MSEILLVSHFHWDREWYRAFEEFRGHLVDAIDAVLDQLDADPGFRFLLDGQAIVLEDYLEVRPQRAAALAAGLQSGRLGAGPWYVQPDSLIPSGETHVRNLLHGRAVTEQFGRASRVAYVPDSFGHPAQFPQLFAGFGLDPFVYWRGNGSELDRLGPQYRWVAPDGSSVRAWYLPEGYFGAGGLDADSDVGATADRLRAVVKRIEDAGGEPVLLMNGFDHLPADTTTAAIAAEVGATRVLLDEAATHLAPTPAREYRGDLLGGRTANLLPGVWSSRMPLKLRNRAIETLLTAWAEPWTAFARFYALPDERASLTRAWRTFLCNQAHDSICGCSIDPVHERMHARYDDAEGLGRATVQRVLERLAGRDRVRTTPWTEEQTITVFNASPYSRTDVVRVPLDAFPPWRISASRYDMHPLQMPSLHGVTVGGEPARLVPSDDPNRVRFLPNVGGLDVEFIARDVPAFGSLTYRMAAADPSPDAVDDGRSIAAGSCAVAAADDGALTVTLGDQTWTGLFGIEDAVDRGDSYDADCDPPRPVPEHATVRRERHAGGIERMYIRRELGELGLLDVVATVAPGQPFVRVDVTLDNRAPDHRLRLRFPTGAPVDTFAAATTFDVTARSTTPADATGWAHPAPRTFPHQGFVAANGLVVGAPGLPEAEMTTEGDLLVTLVRSVGAIAHLELRTRPVPAAPEMPAPGAQSLGPVRATVTLATTARDVRASEVGMWGVLAGPDPFLASGESLLALTAERCEISAVKPAEAVDDGIVVRVLNPTDTAEPVTVTLGVEVDDVRAVRLDETPAEFECTRAGRAISFAVPPHALRSVLVHTLRR